MSEYTPTFDDIVRALSFSYGYGLGGLTPCPDNEVPEDGVGRWLNSVKAEAWDEGHKSGLDTGITIAENVYENGGTLDLEKIPKPGDNPYRTGGAE